MARLAGWRAGGTCGGAVGGGGGIGGASATAAERRCRRCCCNDAVVTAAGVGATGAGTLAAGPEAAARDARAEPSISLKSEKGGGLAPFRLCCSRSRVLRPPHALRPSVASRFRAWIFGYAGRRGGQAEEQGRRNVSEKLCACCLIGVAGRCNGPFVCVFACACFKAASASVCGLSAGASVRTFCCASTSNAAEKRPPSKSASQTFESKRPLFTPAIHQSKTTHQSA